MLNIGRVEIANLMRALRRDAIRNRLGKVAVWVDDRDAFPPPQCRAWRD
jgi:hypothetical protein